MRECPKCGERYVGVDPKCWDCYERDEKSAEFAEDCDRLFQQTQDFGDDE